MYMKKILFVIVVCFSTLSFQHLALAEYSFNPAILSEESEEVKASEDSAVEVEAESVEESADGEDAERPSGPQTNT